MSHLTSPDVLRACEEIPGPSRRWEGAPRLAALLASLLWLLGPGAATAESDLDLWTEAGAGLDTNPYRTPGIAPVASGFASLLGRARLRLGGEGRRAVVTLTEAGRLYPQERGADLLASRLEVAARAGLGDGLSAAFTGAASDATSRDGWLDRHALRGEASLTRESGRLDLALAAGWFLFVPREPSLRPHAAAGPEGWLRAGWRAGEGHRLGAAVGGSRATFPGWAAATGGAERTDDALLLAADWSWRGPALLSAGWAFTRNGSDARGGAFTRHRLAASAALSLPLELTLAARLALQWTRYPDPLLLPDLQRLAEGQEALDAAEARLSRPLAGPLEAVLSLAWYHARAGPGVPRYERSVASLALAWRLTGAGR